MTRRDKIWLVAAGLFNVINFGGLIFAAAGGELSHAGVHAVLLVVGVYYTRRIWRRSVSALPDDLTGEVADRLTRLQESVEAVAAEVERIGEGQRFITRLFTEKGTGKSGAERIERQ